MASSSCVDRIPGRVRDGKSGAPATLWHHYSDDELVRIDNRRPGCRFGAQTVSTGGGSGRARRLDNALAAVLAATAAPAAAVAAVADAAASRAGHAALANHAVCCRCDGRGRAAIRVATAAVGKRCVGHADAQSVCVSNATVPAGRGQRTADRCHTQRCRQ